ATDSRTSTSAPSPPFRRSRSSISDTRSSAMRCSGGWRGRSGGCVSWSTALLWFPDDFIDAPDRPPPDDGFLHPRGGGVFGTPGWGAGRRYHSTPRGRDAEAL